MLMMSPWSAKTPQSIPAHPPAKSPSHSGQSRAAGIRAPEVFSVGRELPEHVLLPSLTLLPAPHWWWGLRKKSFGGVLTPLSKAAPGPWTSAKLWV